MKRILWLAVVFTLAVLLLAGCTEKTAESQTPTNPLPTAQAYSEEPAAPTAPVVSVPNGESDPRTTGTQGAETGAPVPETQEPVDLTPLETQDGVVIDVDGQPAIGGG